MKTSKCAPWMLAVLALAGCEPDEIILADYNLNIVPRVLGSQDPFEGKPDVKLFIDPPTGDPAILYIGEAGNDDVDKGGFDVIPAGSLLGLMIEEPNENKQQYNPDALVAYGETILGDEASAGGQTIEVQMLLAETHSVGKLESLGQAKQSLFGGAALVTGGTVYLFGGTNQHDLASVGTDRIMKMTDTNGGDWSFVKINEVLPLPVVAFTTTLVEVGGEEQVLIAGGREEWGAPTFSNSNRLFLFDPVKERVTWGAGQNHATFPSPRSAHNAVLMDNGNVIFFGGYTYDDETETSTYDVFDPSAQDFLTSGDLDGGILGMAGANLGADGVLVCGGAMLDPDEADLWVPRTDCNRITLQGNVQPAPPLPAALWNHRMASLGNGGVLACGGNEQSLVGNLEDNLGTLAEATNKAFVYDGTSWTPVEGGLHFPRAHHALLTTPDRDVVVVGGNKLGGPFRAVPDDEEFTEDQVEKCSELFDRTANRFTTENGTCTTAGSGAGATVAEHPSEGAFVLEGRWYNGSFMVGGRNYGWLGFGPDLL